jgi:hypothetical protein
MRVSGVPYEVELEKSGVVHDGFYILKLAKQHGWVDEIGRWIFVSTDELMNFVDLLSAEHYADIATLEHENKLMRARMNRLEEECHWLEHLSRVERDDLK